MNKKEHLFTVGAEECIELADESLKLSKRFTKMLRFGETDISPGHDKKNTQRFYEEYADLIGTVEMLQEIGVLPLPDNISIDILKQKKKKKIKLYLKYAKNKGTLND